MQLRRATIDDALDVLNWRNDRDTIAMSKTQGTVDEASHVQWFAMAIENPNRVLLIATEGALKVGMVRFDRSDESWLTSINIAPSERGKGFGLIALKQAIAIARRSVGASSFIAEIKDDNLPSLRIFRSCGFVHESLAGNFHRLRLRFPGR